MKKIIVILSVALTALLCALGAGCGGSDLPSSTPNGEWLEVQSIKYSTNSTDHGTTSYVSTSYILKSTCRFDAETEASTAEEFESAPDDLKKYSYSYYHSSEAEMPLNRKEFLDTTKNSIGKTYYIKDEDYYNATYYYKTTLKSYELRYVRVRFLEDNCIELNYYDGSEQTTIRVLPLSYTVTYFND